LKGHQKSAFALYLNNMTLASMEDIMTAIMTAMNKHASILEVIYREH